MNIEILTIGDEILSGNIIDTNKAYLSDKLWMAGLEVVYHSGVRDDAKTIKEALLLAAKRSDVTIVTGGLGPTADDFTIEVAAKTFKKKLVRNEEYLKYLSGLYKQWGREMKENNKKQADIPEGGKTFRNKVGTAPGIGVTYNKKQFYFLPGVPREMKQLFEDSILPEIISLQKNPLCFVSKMLKCFGAAESDLDFALRDLYMNRLDIENVRTGFRAHFPETFIKLSAWAKTKEQAKKSLKIAEDKVLEKVGKHVYGADDDTLDSIVAELLTKKKKTISTAESCTGGHLANRLTNIAGSSKYFINGTITYHNDAKINVLGIPSDTIKKYGAVSSQCAIEMASHIRRISKTDFGISITGIAGPDGGTAMKPVGTVHIGFSSEKGTTEKKYVLPSRGRESFKLLVSSIALNTIRKELMG